MGGNGVPDLHTNDALLIGGAEVPGLFADLAARSRPTRARDAPAAGLAAAQ